MAKKKAVRVRRTKAELEAGMTQEEKKAQVLGRKKAKDALKPKKEKTEVKKPEEKEVIIKEVRIINDTTGTKQTVQEVLNEELGKCSWEWKRITMDKDFKLKLIEDLGKDGWKFAFIHEPGLINDKLKNKPNVLCMQRPRHK